MTKKTNTESAIRSAQGAATGSGQVTDFISKLDASLRPSVELLRQVILSADTQIAEQIKWNSPCFYYSGPMKPFNPKEYKRDIVVMNLHRNKLMLVFPTGAVVDDPSGLLTGNYKDGRKIIQFADLADIKKRKADLIAVIRDWLSKVE